MENTYLNFIETLDQNFNEFQDLFLLMLTAFNKKDLTQFRLLRDDWDKVNQTQGPLTAINYALIDYDDSGDLPKQVKSILLNNQLGVIEYTKIILKRQYDFIVKEFKDYAYEYSNNANLSIDLLDRMYNQDKTLTDDEFLKAVAFQFFEAYAGSQDSIHSAYPLFKRQMFKQKEISSRTFENTALNVINVPQEHELIETIRLNYADEYKIDVIKLIHDTWNGVFIDNISLENFAEYFDSGHRKPKLKWKGKDLELIYLFRGIEVPITFNRTDTVMISIKNDPINLICKTFTKKKGSFYHKSLTDNFRKSIGLDNRINPSLRDLAMEITRKFKK